MKTSGLTEELKDCLETVPERKKELKEAIVKASEHISQLKHSMHIIEARTYMLTLKNPDLKTETVKKEAVFLKLNTDKGYTQIQTELHKHELDKGLADAELTKLRAKIALYRLLLQSMELDKE